MKRILSALAILSLAASANAATIYLGNTTTSGASSTTGGNSQFRASMFTATVSGSINRLSGYFGSWVDGSISSTALTSGTKYHLAFQTDASSGAGNVVIALYADSGTNTPTSLIVATSALAVGETTYYFQYGDDPTQKCNGPSRAYDGTAPDPFGDQSSRQNRALCLYAWATDSNSPTVTPVVSPTPTPTSSPTRTVTATPIAGLVTVYPDLTNDVLYNPGMGFTTFGKVEGENWDAEPPDDYPYSTIAYFRVYWDEIEPTEGAYDWTELDGYFSRAAGANQKVALRVMLGDGGCKLPAWLLAAGATGVWYRPYGDGGNDPKFFPHYDNAVLMEHLEILIAALGNRYNSNPRLDHFDIGGFGQWGEWHNAEAVNGSYEPVTFYPRPSTATLQNYVDWVHTAFPDVPILGQIDDPPLLEYALTVGAGWRADGTGDYWHDYTMYPEHVTESGCEDTWQTAPVAFETYSDFQWFSDAAVQEAIATATLYHCSIFNNKSQPVLEGQWQYVTPFLRKLGYRLQVISVAHPGTQAKASAMSMTAKYCNLGIAPPYRNYTMLYRLRQGSTTYASKTSTAQTLGWMPGVTQTVTDSWDVSALDNGHYYLDMAGVDATGRTLQFPFSNGSRTDGWYPVSELEVTDEEATPTPVVTPTPTATPTPTPSASQTATPIHSPTITPTPIPSTYRITVRPRGFMQWLRSIGTRW